MKKFLIAVFLILFAFGGIANAAWTKEITNVQEFPWRNGQRMFLITLECTSDASASGDITISSQIATDKPNDLRISHMVGGTLYAIEYVPDDTDTPTSAPTITLDTEDGTLIFSEAAAVAGTGEMFDGQVDSGFLVPITDLIFASTTLANTKKAVFKIWILK